MYDTNDIVNQERIIILMIFLKVKTTIIRVISSIESVTIVTH